MSKSFGDDRGDFIARLRKAGDKPSRIVTDKNKQKRKEKDMLEESINNVIRIAIKSYEFVNLPLDTDVETGKAIIDTAVELSNYTAALTNGTASEAPAPALKPAAKPVSAAPKATAKPAPKVAAKPAAKPAAKAKSDTPVSTEYTDLPFVNIDKGEAYELSVVAYTGDSEGRWGTNYFFAVSIADELYKLSMSNATVAEFLKSIVAQDVAVVVGREAGQKGKYYVEDTDGERLI